MAVITISRSYASGGSLVAGRVAEILGWTLIDNEFVDRVAERAGMPREQVAEREEKAPSLIDRLAATLAVTSPEIVVAGSAAPPMSGPQAEDALLRITEAVISEAVAHGNTVIVGRGAQAYLAERTGVLHVFVTAPRAARIEQAMKRLGASRRDAERAVDDTDGHRARYVKTHYHRAWGDPANYHLIVNTTLLGIEGASAVVVASARATVAAPQPTG